jgi:hypothetical protein
VQEIVTKLADQKVILSQFGEQHKHFTEPTTVDNMQIAEECQNLQAWREARPAVMQEIIVSKNRFLKER